MFNNQLAGGKLIAAFSHFCGANTLTLADVKLPTVSKSYAKFLKVYAKQQTVIAKFLKMREKALTNRHEQTPAH